MSKEAKARIKINGLLKEADWKFFDDAEGINRERSRVEGNRELIQIYEEKVKKVIPARGGNVRRCGSPNIQTLKVSSVNQYQIWRESLAFQVT